MDLTSIALRALATQNGCAPALAFAAGAASSFGPCVAPRALAVAALTANKPATYAIRVVASFTAGIIAAYSLFSLGGTLVWQAVRFSGYVYVVVATVMAVAGLLALIQHSTCERASRARTRNSMSAVFLMGASSAATISPCCMPILATVALYAHSTGAVFAWLTASCFALGHAAPLILAAAGSKAIALTVKESVQSAARVVSGTLMLAVAAFCYVLA